MSDSFLREPSVSLVMKCAACGETLLFGREVCQYCGVAVDREHALRSALAATLAAQACSLANTIRTGKPAILIIVAQGLFLYLMGWKIPFAIVILGEALLYCFASIRWRYRYADIKLDDEDFKQTQREMKKYLHLWLGFVAVVVFVILIWK